MFCLNFFLKRLEKYIERCRMCDVRTGGIQECMESTDRGFLFVNLAGGSEVKFLNVAALKGYETR